jgi:archaellum component FlaC
MAKTFADVEKQIRDLEAKIRQLGGEGYPDLDKAIQGMSNSLENAERFAKSLSDEVSDLENVFDSISKTLQNVVKDLDNRTKTTTRIIRSFNKLENIASKLSEHKKEEEILTVKQLTSLAKKTKLEYDSLVASRDKAKAELEYLDVRSKQYKELKHYYDEVNQALITQGSYLRKIADYSLQEVEREKEIQQTLGLTGQIFKGIEKSLEHIGIESEAIKEISKNMRDAAKSGSQLAVAMTAVKSTFKAALEGLKDPVVYMKLLVEGFKELYHIGAEFSKETYEIAKNQLVTSKEAHHSAEEIKDLAAHSKEALGYQKNFVEATNALNDSLGTSVDFSGKTLEDFTNLTKKLGLTNDEAASFARFSQITGKTQEEIVNSIGKQNKGVISNKKVLTEVAKVNGQLYAQYKGSPDLIGKAVIQTQKLGITLQQAQGIAKGLLNFESSISAELEAELLTGKQLNLEQARYLALQGDSAGAAQEVLRQVGSLAEYQRLNVIQQEALAKAAGMETDELANSLIKQEQLKHILGDQTSLYQKRIQELRKEGKVEQANELEKQILQGKTLEIAELNLDAQSRISAASEKMKDSFNSIIAGPLGTIVETVASLFEKLATSNIGRALFAGVGLIGAVTIGVGAILALGNTIRNLFTDKRGDFYDKPIYTFNTNTKDGGTGAIEGVTTERDYRSYPQTSTSGKLAKLKKAGKFANGLNKYLPYVGAALSLASSVKEDKGFWETLIRTGLTWGGGAIGGAIAAGETIATSGFGAIAAPALVAGGAMAGESLGDAIFGAPMAMGGIVPSGYPNDTFPAKLSSGEAVVSIDKLYAKFDELITATKAGGNVIMDGSKFAHIGAMNTFSIG